MFKKDLFVVMLLLYAISFIIGYNVKMRIEDVCSDHLSNLNVVNVNRFDQFLSIYKNNMYVLFYNIIGSLTFGILSIVSLLYNGFFLGQLFQQILKSNGLLSVFPYFLPHSFELIAIVWSSCIGIQLAYVIYNYMFTSEKVLINNRSIAIQILLCIIIIALAALVESYVSIH